MECKNQIRQMGGIKLGGQYYSYKRLFKITILLFSRIQMPGHIRAKILKLAGVRIPDTTGVSIGEGVLIDRLYPENIVIGHHVRITMNCTILTHYFDTSFLKLRFNRGKVQIGNWCFLGTGVIICAPVTIGDYSVVGAGAIVTKDIPPYEIWGGNPAKFIKVRPGYEEEHSKMLDSVLVKKSSFSFPSKQEPKGGKE